MDHGGEAARPTTMGSAELGMPGAVRGSEANIGSGAAPGSFSAVAGRGVVVPVAAEFYLHHEPGPGAGGVAYPNDIGASWRQLGPVHVVLAGPQLPGGAVTVHDSYGYYAPQPRPGAGRRVVLAALLPAGADAVYSWGYALQPRPGARHGEALVDLLPEGAGHGEVFVGLLPGGAVDAAYDSHGYYELLPRPGAGHGEVLVDLLPDGAAHGEVFVGLLPGGVDAAYDNYGYFALQPRPGAGQGEALVDLLPDGAGHGEVLVGLLPGGGGAAHDDYGYYSWQWQPRPGGVGSGEVFIGPLPDAIGAMFDNSGNFAQQTLLGTGRADGIAGALRDLNLGAVYDNRGLVSEHLRRLLPFAGIGASSVAINGLAAGPGSPAVAFQLFVLLLGGLFLIILHVLRV